MVFPFTSFFHQYSSMFQAGYLLDKMEFEQTLLPAPSGPFQVGYLDLMTPGSADSSSLLRIHYPAPANASITSPPLWADSYYKSGYVRFIQTMMWDWPSWVNNAEFQLLPLAKKIFSPSSFFSFLRGGWNLVAEVLTIPIIRAAPLAPHVGSGWPVVVFSHGMGCNRVTMSQLCYQLASNGVVVVAVEHREGSGFGTFCKNGSDVEEITHLRVPADENEYKVRNNQLNHRQGEIVRAIDVLAKMNAGQAIHNVIDSTDNDSIESDLVILKSSMDLTNNLFLMGHSFGGSTVLLASSDTRVKGVLAMDPWMFPLAGQEFAIDKPTHVVNTKLFANQKNLEVINEALTDTSEVTFEVYEDGVHLSATDLPSVFTQTVLRKGIGFVNKVDPAVVMVETHKIVWNWLKNIIS